MKSYGGFFILVTALCLFQCSYEAMVSRLESSVVFYSAGKYDKKYNNENDC